MRQLIKYTTQTETATNNLALKLIHTKEKRTRTRFPSENKSENKSEITFTCSENAVLKYICIHLKRCRFRLV